MMRQAVTKYSRYLSPKHISNMYLSYDDEQFRQMMSLSFSRMQRFSLLIHFMIPNLGKLTVIDAGCIVADGETKTVSYPR